MNADAQSASSAEFFVAGGTLPASAPSYVSRPADEQLFDAAVAGQFCYVLTTRQMGKSSLMVRTARRLQQQGVRTAIIDLTTMGGKTEETWYLDFLTELSDQLKLTQEMEAWWQEHATLGAVRRFSNFLRDVLLEECNNQVVIFVDEIDFTLGLPFADDFFAAVRATYNARALDAKFNRLTFIFLGVAAPADLIKDRTRTPFNIGEGIVLRDFDRTDAAVLQQGLEATYPEQSQTILDRIFYWTAGHPYLTQKLCREVVDQKHSGPWTPTEVDQVVNDLFLSDQTNRELNLQFVQDRVLKNPHRRELLKLYSKVRAGKSVVNDEQSVLQNQLKLAGLVTTNDGNLRVHNEIYRVVFDAKWIKANTPRDSNRIVAYAAVALAVLVVGLTGIILLRNSYVQRQSDQLQLEFTQVGTPFERLDRLTQLFDLQGILNTSNFDDAARRLFFDMNSRQDQLALFQVQDGRVVGVIEGLYTALADVNKSGENDELLKAMRDALQKQGSSVEASRLKDEIDYWLKAREYARKNQYNDALAEYGKAIRANSDDSNPATHFERAQVMLDLPSPVYPQALSDLDTAIAAAGKLSEAKSDEVEAESDGALDVTLTPTPTRTPSSIPNATVGPTVLPTLVATSRQTPVPVPTAAGQQQPPPPPDAGQRPFRSQFITFVQIASAMRRLIDSSPGLVGFLANSAQSDYGNLRVANLVRTLTPTPRTTPTQISVGTGTPTLSPISCAAGSDQFEPNDDFDSAATIGLNVRYTNLNFVQCTLNPDSNTWDNDYLTVRIKPDMLITCESLDLSPGTDTKLTLYDEKQNLIGENDDRDRIAGDLSSQVVYSATYNGPLYAQISEGSHRPASEALTTGYSFQCILGAQSTPGVVDEIFRRTNELRQNNKLSPYTLNSDLNQVALAHSQDMANRDQVTHIGADGSTAAQRITNAGYGAGQPAENIYGGQATEDDAWAFWTTDPPHLANLLNSVNTDIGIGVVEGQSNTYYTIVFGKPAQSIVVTPQSAPTAAVSDAQNEARKVRARSENPLIVQAGGQMIFGTDDPNRNRPFDPAQQTLLIAPFAIEQTEVTNDLYRLCVEAGACDRPQDTRFFDDPVFAQHPVAFVTASQAAAYCTWLGRRLPTEPEWERAVRGLSGRAWPWGNSAPTPDRAQLLWGNDDALAGPRPIKSLEGGRSPEGVYDLIGNVSEWTSATLQCTVETCTRGVWDGNDGTAVLAIRGGGFSSSDFVRSTLTQGASPNSSDAALGFRCAQNLVE